MGFSCGSGTALLSKASGYQKHRGIKNIRYQKHRDIKTSEFLNSGQFCPAKQFRKK